MAEKEYIERGALIAEYDRVHVGAPGGARRLMVDAPAADVVEVVRCKDCEHYKAVVSTCGNCYRTICIQHTEDFCSYGKRKEETT